MSLLLGYDVGSSSIKAPLMESQTGKVLATATSPEKELEIIAEKLGWAEQHPGHVAGQCEIGHQEHKYASAQVTVWMM